MTRTLSTHTPKHVYALRVTSATLRLGGNRIPKGTMLAADGRESIIWGPGTRDGFSVIIGRDHIGFRRAFVPASAVVVTEERDVEVAA